MASWPAHLFLFLLCLVLLAGAVTPQTAPPPSVDSADRWTRSPECQSRCGNVSIPYPFGIDHGCFRKGFEINCTNGTAYLGLDGNIDVVDIQLFQGTLVVNNYIAQDCYYQNGSQSESDYIMPWIDMMGLPNYKFSSDRNRFVAIGCDAEGYMSSDEESTFWTGCSSYCTNASFVPNGTCSGIGCCSAPIPKDLRSFWLEVHSFDNHSNCSFALCSYAFLTDVGKLNFTLSSFTEYKNKENEPLTLDWAIMNQTCEEANGTGDFACVSPNSYCLNSTNGPGYLCNCSQGFQGNPYLDGSNGCTDINECSADINSSPCVKRCHNNREGSYSCSCPWYMYGDGQRDGSGCTSILSILYLSLGAGFSLFFLIAIASWLYWIYKKRKLGELKQHFFEKNGGSLRQDIRLFSSEELEAASDNYNQSRILGEGGAGTVYRGVLPNQNVIAIKKAKISNDEAEVQQFINEVEVLSRINHRNVVKLLGCCLESQVPMLVYEFVSNGTLAHHLHSEGHRGSLSLEARLRISTEVAGSLSYLHSAASTPVIHRDVKTTNILLDHNLTAKVSDFGASRLVPLDQNGLVSLVRGTFGYLDPEYLLTGEFTDKSDVYSFGVVLVELLTGKKPVAKMQAAKNLTTLFIDCVNSGRLVEILEERVVDEGTPEFLEAAAELAMRCLSLNSNDRPLMREVALELEALTRWRIHPWGNVHVEEGDSLLAMVGSSSPSVLRDYVNSSMEPMAPFEIFR